MLAREYHSCQLPLDAYPLPHIDRVGPSACSSLSTQPSWRIWLLRVKSRDLGHPANPHASWTPDQDDALRDEWLAAEPSEVAETLRRDIASRHGRSPGTPRPATCDRKRWAGC